MPPRMALCTRQDAILVTHGPAAQDFKIAYSRIQPYAIGTIKGDE